MKSEKKIFYYTGFLLFLLMVTLTVLIFIDIPSSFFKKAISEWVEKQWDIKAEIMKVRPTLEPSLRMEDVTITIKGTVPVTPPQSSPYLRGGREGLSGVVESGLSPKYNDFSIKLRKVDIYPVWYSLLSGRFTWRITSTTQSNGSINGVISESTILNWKDIVPSDIKIKALPFRLSDRVRISGNASIKRLEGLRSVKANDKGTIPKTLDISIFGLPTGNTSFRLSHPSVEGKVTVFIKTL